MLCSDNPGVHAFSLSQEYQQFHTLTGRVDILEAMLDRQTAVAFGRPSKGPEGAPAQRAQDRRIFL